MSCSHHLLQNGFHFLWLFSINAQLNFIQWMLHNPFFVNWELGHPNDPLPVGHNDVFVSLYPHNVASEVIVQYAVRYRSCHARIWFNDPHVHTRSSGAPSLRANRCDGDGLTTTVSRANVTLTHCPADTRRNNNVTIMFKRCCDVFLT